MMDSNILIFLTCARQGHR